MNDTCDCTVERRFEVMAIARGIVGRAGPASLVEKD